MLNEFFNGTAPGGDTGPNLDGLTTLYTGTGAEQTIVNNVDLVNNDGMVWIKRSDASAIHMLFDTVRGATNYLMSNGDNAESTQAESLKTFNDNGFTVGTYQAVNTDQANYVAWTFSKAAGYFDVIEQKGLSGVTTIPHNLGTKPGMILAKKTNTTQVWLVYHSGVNATSVGVLNEPNAWATSNAYNDQEPTDTEFYWNRTGDFIFYLFAEDTSGTIKCGSYVGNATQNRQIDVGFEPQFVLIKSSSTDNRGWIMVDNKRGTGNLLQANDTGGNNTTTVVTEFNSTGFKIGTNSTVNGNGSDYVYMAIAA